MSTELSDFMSEGISGCCGAQVCDPGGEGMGICMDCKEHCDVVKEE